MECYRLAACVLQVLMALAGADPYGHMFCVVHCTYPVHCAAVVLSCSNIQLWLYTEARCSSLQQSMHSDDSGPSAVSFLKQRSSMQHQ